MYDLIFTSGDILNIVLAAAIALVAILLAWGMFYMAMILRSIFRMIRDVEEIIKETKEAISFAKVKAQSGAVILKAVSQAFKSFSSLADKKQASQKKNNNKKTKKK